MDSRNTEQLVGDDKRYVGHPFTSMGKWCVSDHQPIVRESRGRNTFTLLPPLIVSINQLDTALNILAEALQTVLTQKKQRPQIGAGA